MIRKNINEKKNEDNKFMLIMPNGRKNKCRVTQSSRTGLITNPQSVLEEWVLKDLLGLKHREVATMDHLNKVKIDSMRLVKLENGKYEISVAEYGAFEKFKLENKKDIIKTKLKGSKLPCFELE